MSPRHHVRLLASALTVLALVATSTAATADEAPVTSGFDGFTFTTEPLTGRAPDPVAGPGREVSTRSSVPGEVCPAPHAPQPVPNFRDIAGSPHETNIVCVARWGIARGTGERTYAPRRDVTRAQMATFVANLIRATGAALPEGRDRFSDDDGSPHEPNINALANAGVISGVSGGGYAPGRNVTRAQAATILAGAYRHLLGFDLTVGPDQFRDDDGSPHEANINRLANAGIINGLSATRFGHADSLKRDQMASLLARFLPRVVGTGAFGTGTVYYSEYGELHAIDAADPTHSQVLYEFGVLDTFTVNTHRGEFTYVEHSPVVYENLNEVHVRSLSDNQPRTTFRWIDQCETGDARRPLGVPLASPDGEWFIAMMDNGSRDNVEIRDRRGGCVAEFGRELVAADSWSWFANGDLLMVVDGIVVPDIAGDWALARFPREVLANQAGEVEVLRTFDGTHPPTQTAVSTGQGNVAYIWDRDLYVLDLSTDDSNPATRPHHRVARSSADLMWPAFSPDDRSIILRNRTNVRVPGVTPSNGQVHVVANHRGPTTLVETDGPTELAIPQRPGGQPLPLDAKGPLYWAP
ncbi:hypothetical protein FTX61_20355 [Nitriliruptoraceae bacterium ZYF776]|nr:hypothetical protein [Profundirhabdus halotolerans]